MTIVPLLRRSGWPLGTTILLSFMLVMGVFQINRALTYSLPSLSDALALKQEPLSSTVILQQIQGQSKLVTATASGWVEMPRGSMGGNFFQRPFYKDYLVIMAYGSVWAGLDLRDIHAITVKDIHQTKEEVTVYLPPPKIIVSKLDNRLTHTLYRETGWVKNLFQGPNILLEGEARNEAESKLRTTYCEQALTRAQDEAEAWMQGLVEGILLIAHDQRRVRVVVAPGQCA